MTKFQAEVLFKEQENFQSTLFLIESLIKTIKDICISKEINSIYYSNIEEYKYALSQERNDYANLMLLALEKIDTLKEQSLILEKELFNLQKNSDNCC